MSTVGGYWNRMRDVWQAANLCARIVAVKFVGMIRGFEVGGEIESSDSKDGDVLVEGDSLETG